MPSRVPISLYFCLHNCPNMSKQHLREAINIFQFKFLERDGELSSHKSHWAIVIQYIQLIQGGILPT